MSEAVLVIDVGTSKVHANIIGADDGALLRGAAARIPWLHPQPGWTETVPEDLWDALVSAVGTVISQKPADVELIAIGCSFQGDVFSLRDENGETLYNFVVSMDRRGASYLPRFAKDFGEARWRSILGCGLIPFEPMKYCYMLEHFPHLMEKTAHIASVQEYVMYRMGLGYCQDYTLASRKVMWDVGKDCWSKELCDFVGIDMALIDSPVFPSGQIVGTVSSIGGVELGKALPCVIGGHDSEMGMLGVGVTPSGSRFAADIAGTSDHIGLLLDRLVDTETLHGSTYRGPFKGSFVYIGVASVGASVNWGIKTFFAHAAAEDFDRTIAEVYEQLPFDGNGRVMYAGGIPAGNGRFFGIDLSAGPLELFQGLAEGNVYPLKAVVEDVRKVHSRPLEALRIGGGGAKSASLCRLKANILELPVERVENNEISSVGASILACLAIGKYQSLAEAQSRMIRVRDRFFPDGDTAVRYRRNYARWRALM